MINLPPTGLSNDNANTSYISDDRESDSTKYLHVYENNRKAYPQRNNRSRLNYRDLERGMYEDIRQSTWTLNGTGYMVKNNNRCYNDGEHEVIDLSMDDDEDEIKSIDDTDQTHRRLWCICQKPWDHSRLMLRCDGCANWYHGDCIGISAEKAKLPHIDPDQFVCSPCRGIPYSTMKRAKSSEESISTKRKHVTEISSTRTNGIPANRQSHDQSTKKLKANTNDQQNALAKSKTHCIARDCSKPRESGWVYCSSACIRRHFNETLQDVQRSKGPDNVDIPTSDDILLYESKTKQFLKKSSVPKIEDLFSWINQHPSYQILKSSSRKSHPSTSKQSNDSIRSVSRPTKSKSVLRSMSVNPKTNAKFTSNEKNLIPLGKPTNKTTSSTNSPTDIRSKVPTALYEKIIMRLEKKDESESLKQTIRTRVNQVEQEMFRVYGKVDNSYKNKFRSLLANISNTNNHFFYKEILSPTLTAKDIVAMKPEDMLPPEEREKRKGQFEKEIQMIIKSQEEKAVEMARRMKTKATKQGLVDNDTNYSLLVENSKEQNSTDVVSQTKIIEPVNIDATADQPIESTPQPENRPTIQSTKKTVSDVPTPSSTTEQINPTTSTADLDNDYIEPESPTGIDALIYDEEDNDDDINPSSQSSTSHSSTENVEDVLPYQPIIREDYNPLKAKNESSSVPASAPIVPSPNQWRGVIHPPDTKLPCQSVHIYGENEHLISHIPEQLVILGRLRLADLWDYIANSLAVRDILILTLISSSLLTNDNESFSQYVDTMRKSGRAAVISKCTNPSLIRDMYILAADTKECPSSVFSTFSLPMTFDSKELFLVIIGSGKRTNRSVIRDHVSNHLTYKPIVLQDSTVTRDPRLQKNKDPRLNRHHKTNENTVLPIQQAALSATENLLQLISDSLQRIRHAPTADDIRSTVMSTTATLETHRRNDLNIQFHEQLRTVLVEWQTLHENTSIAISTGVTGDNFTEENMDVDEDQDEKQKKQQIISSASHAVREFKDIDYRFLDQEMDQAMTNRQKPQRKSRFSDVLPSDFDRLKKPKLSTEKALHKGKGEKSMRVNPILPSNRTKIASPEIIDTQINAPFNTKFSPRINAVEQIPFTVDTGDNSIPNSRHASSPGKSSRSNESTTNLKDADDSSSKVSIRTPEQYSSAFVNNVWTKQLISSQSTRSATTLNSFPQHEPKKRFSTSSNEWRSRNSHSYYMTHYYDFDQPQE